MHHSVRTNSSQHRTDQICTLPTAASALCADSPSFLDLHIPVLCVHLYCTFTDCIRVGGNAIPPSICPSVCFQSSELADRWQWTFAYEEIMIIAHRRLKVKVRSRSRSDLDRGLGFSTFYKRSQISKVKLGHWYKSPMVLSESSLDSVRSTFYDLFCI